MVLDVNTKYSPKVKLYGLASGKTGSVKVYKKDFTANPIQVGDVITALKHRETPAYTFAGGERKVRPGVKDVWMTEYTIDYREDDETA